jgi:hypothetical protein
MEVLVASCIMGLTLGLILTGFSMNMKNAEIANDYITAVQLLQKKFNELSTAKNLKEGKAEGDFGETFGNYKWKSFVHKKDKNQVSIIRVEVTFNTGNESRTYSVRSMIFSAKKKDKTPGQEDKKKKKPQPDVDSGKQASSDLPKTS